MVKHVMTGYRRYITFTTCHFKEPSYQDIRAWGRAIGDCTITEPMILSPLCCALLPCGQWYEGPFHWSPVPCLHGVAHYRIYAKELYTIRKGITTYEHSKEHSNL